MPRNPSLAIADEHDLIASVHAVDLIAALEIAAEQLDVKTDDDAEGYGLATADEAHALRERLLDVLRDVAPVVAP